MSQTLALTGDGNMASRTRFRVKQLASEKGWSLRKLSIHTSIRYPTIWEVANNVGNPTINTLEKIAGGLGVEVPDLFERKQDTD
jgi:transcriptional regulator with XRE-family HTH domain